MVVPAKITEEKIREILASVPDPEIPVISIVDLGIVRKVAVEGDSIDIELTPTYSGCPALDVIPIMVQNALKENGIEHANVRNIISPPWTTDWISESGKEKLRQFGISPPHPTDSAAHIPLEERQITCPQCSSDNTNLVSRFGSTPCKAAFQCQDCLEPFDHFKCH